MDENPYKSPQTEGEALPFERRALTMRRVIANISGGAFVLSAASYGYCYFTGLIGPAGAAHWTTLTFLAGGPQAFLHPYFQGRLRWFRWLWVGVCIALLAQSAFYLRN